MVRTLRPAQAGLPHRGAEDQHGEKKEDARHFEPDNSTHAAKGSQKAAQSCGDAARGLSGNLAGGAGLRGRGACGRSRAAGGSLGAGGNALAGNAPGNAQPDSQGPADGLRFHFDLMVTAGAQVPPLRVRPKFPVALRRRWK